MRKYTPWIVLAVFIFIVGTIMFFQRSHVKAEAPLTAEQIEEQTIVKHIMSGSSLWKHANEQAIKWETERTRQAEGTRGYRYTLCTKFGKIVDANGAVQLAGNPLQGAPDCSSFQ